MATPARCKLWRESPGSVVLAESRGNTPALAEERTRRIAGSFPRPMTAGELLAAGEHVNVDLWRVVVRVEELPSKVIESRPMAVATGQVQRDAGPGRCAAVGGGAVIFAMISGGRPPLLEACGVASCLWAVRVGNWRRREPGNRRTGAAR